MKLRLLFFCVCFGFLSFAQNQSMKVGFNPWFENPFKSNVNWATETNPWNNLWFQDAQGFKCIRMLDFSSANWSTEVNWGDRTLKTAVSNGDGAVWQGKPIAWEWCIDLCNKTNSDLWINIPHKSVQNYWQGIANLIKTQLNPDLKVYVEYSNEVWNGTFSDNSWDGRSGQHTWCVENGKQLIPSAWDDKYCAAYQVKQSVQIWKTFEDVFGTDKNRVINVLGCRHDIPYYIEYCKEYLINTSINPNAVRCESFAIAPYFGLRWGVELNFCNSDRMKILRDEMNWALGLVPESFNYANASKSTFNYPATPLVCYEGGQQIYNSCADVANRNPEIYTIYTDYLEGLKPYFTLFNHYGFVAPFSNQYAWGLKEAPGQNNADAHKYRAIKDFIAKYNSNTTAKPFQLEAEQYQTMYGVNNEGSSIGSNDNGDWIKFNAVDFSTGYKQVVSKLAVHPNYANETVEFRIDNLNGELAATLSPQSTGTWVDFKEQTAVFKNSIIGVHDLYITFKAKFDNTGVGDFDWFRFQNSDLITEIALNNYEENRMVYPNPFSDKINIRKNADWILNNANGAFTKNGFGSVIETSSLNQGMYLLKLSDGSVHKLIK